jgi:cytochrome c biogenesis protein CcmG/thiol:disulfide interchange protein DsbE
MGSDKTARRVLTVLSCLVVVIVLVVVATGGPISESSPGDPGSGNPASKLTLEQATAPLKDAPPELADIRDEANQVISDGGALQDRLDSLKAAGIPVVVNKWASWCGPCRQEFPDFQEQAEKYGGKVAFLGLNSNDGESTAGTFLSEFPVPYPSYSDPDQKVANDLDIQREFPSTLFIDSSGGVSFVQRGPFASPAALGADIRKIAG